MSLVCLLLCKKEGFAITEKRDMGLYEVPLSMSLLEFGMMTMLASFHMCGIMLVLRTVFNMLVMNASPKGPMYFRFLMFSLSGPCELLFLLCFFCLLDPSCGECNVISLYFMCCSVNGSVSSANLKLVSCLPPMPTVQQCPSNVLVLIRSKKSLNSVGIVIIILFI